MLIRRVASGINGLDTLFAEDEESKYARRWGALYIKLKRETYWFFIPQYFWVIFRSAIIAFTQVTPLVEYHSRWLTDPIIIGSGSDPGVPLDRPRGCDIL